MPVGLAITVPELTHREHPAPTPPSGPQRALSPLAEVRKEGEEGGEEEKGKRDGVPTPHRPRDHAQIQQPQSMQGESPEQTRPSGEAAEAFCGLYL